MKYAIQLLLDKPELMEKLKAGKLTCIGFSEEEQQTLLNAFVAKERTTSRFDSNTQP
ncbi:competence pheromone ComX [Bacillaceae bacterium SIJ1]|uniref:competence pheromone ComX n=1 Tax=Litoribacterium kuwaitense TaxID=1398745 RepID=UPI0013E9F2EC|nr:competence pheromone ComX [Litoribacterium kuwaitense]NGP43941.1 competence pheromone ComX [Litoribacterium kuwaitense]